MHGDRFDGPKSDAPDAQVPEDVERQASAADRADQRLGIEAEIGAGEGDSTRVRESIEVLQERDRERVERGLEGVKKELDVVEDERGEGAEAVEQPQSQDTIDPTAIEQDTAPPSFGERIGDFAKRIWYPSSDRLVRVALPAIAASGLTIGAGVIGASALGLLGASAAILGGVAFAAGEVMKRLHQRDIGSVMSVTKVYERLTSDASPQMVGELHLVGSEGLARVRAAPREQKGRVFFGEVQRSLQVLEEHIRTANPSVADLEGFFGETDVFARRDLEHMGLPFEEVPIPTWRRPILWGSDKVAKAISGRWRELGKSRRPRPVSRVHFTRDQFLEAMEASRERNES